MQRPICVPILVFKPAFIPVRFFTYNCTEFENGFINDVFVENQLKYA